MNAADVGVEALARPERHYWIRKLMQHGPLSDEDRRVLAPLLSARVQAVERGVSLVEAGEAPSDLFVVLEGFASSQRPSAERRGQIVALHLPGDMCDFDTLLKQHLDCAIVALTPLKVAAIGRAAIARLIHEQPHCARLLWCEAMGAMAIRGQWIARLAQGGARVRIANFLCEIAVRLYVVGLAQDDGFDLPFTQTDLANCCGMTSEHTNRVMRELRERGIVNWDKGRLDLLDWDALSAIGNFDTSFLHFRQIRQAMSDIAMPTMI